MVIIQQQITSSEVDATNNNDAIEPSAFPLNSAPSVPQVAPNLADGYEQPNIVSRQHLSIESTSVTPGKPVQLFDFHTFTHIISTTFSFLN